MLRLLVDHADATDDDCVFPTERWATTLRSVAQLLLLDLASIYGYPPPDLGQFLYREAKQPAPSRFTLLEEVTTELCGGSTA